jgi:hypothetical protein
MYLNGDRLSNLTKKKCTMDSNNQTAFSLMDKQVRALSLFHRIDIHNQSQVFGNNGEIVPYKSIEQRWRLSDWPEG